MRSSGGDKERSAVYQTKRPETLKVKAGKKLVSTILAASTVCEESRLGSTSRRGYYAPNVRADGFGATRFRLEPLPGSCMDRGVPDVFLRRKDNVRSYWSNHFFEGNKMKKSSDEPPPITSTGLEVELTKHTMFS